MVVHTFLWVVAGHCFRTWNIKSHNFFVLCRIWVKFPIRTRLIGSFPSRYRSWSCAKEKLHSTPVYTLHQLKRDEGLFPPLPISLADKNGLKNLPRQIFGCLCEVWWQSVQRCRNSMTKPVRTCPQYSDHVRSLRNAFFALLNALILQYYVLSCWNCML